MSPVRAAATSMSWSFHPTTPSFADARRASTTSRTCAWQGTHCGIPRSHRVPRRGNDCVVDDKHRLGTRSNFPKTRSSFRKTGSTMVLVFMTNRFGARSSFRTTCSSLQQTRLSRLRKHALSAPKSMHRRSQSGFRFSAPAHGSPYASAKTAARMVCKTSQSVLGRG